MTIFWVMSLFRWEDVKIKLLIALLLFVPGVAFGDLTPSFPAGEVFINFDKPKGSVNTFTAEEFLILTNSANVSDFSGLTVSIEGLSGITVTPNPASGTVTDATEKVLLTFFADSTMAEGRYSDDVKLKVSGDGISMESITITIEIKHPLPTINATWDTPNLDNVKAGSILSNILTVTEVMGYKSVENVAISIFDLGPGENITYDGTIGDFDPLSSKDIRVNITIPRRGLKPGRYSIVPRINSSVEVTANLMELKYTIPSPKMEIRPSGIDFGKITFETGKDSETVAVNVSEIGGYTPIEKLSISLLKGEDGWISYPEWDYIPPGESKNYNFGIFLPPDASLGLKNWEFELNTLYGGSRNIQAVVIVSFPGTDEAIAYLKNTSSVTGSAAEESLTSETISLLEISKGKTQLRKIAMVMSVYSGTRTFLSNLKTYKNTENLIEAGDSIVRAKAALTKMQIGDQNLQDAELKIHSGKIVSSTEQLWESEARNILKTLQEKAESEKNSNYKLTALYYNRIGKVLTLLNEPQNSEQYFENQEVVEELYHNSLLNAGTLTQNANSQLASAREKTILLGEDTYIVINPFAYDFVSKDYRESIDKFEQAEALYRRAGEESDAELLRAEREKIAVQKNNIYRTFALYGSFLGLLTLWFISRVVWGLQMYFKDEREGRWGDVITGDKSKGK